MGHMKYNRNNRITLMPKIQMHRENRRGGGEKKSYTHRNG